MDLILFWFVVSIIVAVFASSRNRSGFGWFLISLIISPLISFIFLAILPKKVIPHLVAQQPQSLEDKSKAIERLRTENVITEEEYQIKRKRIIEED